MQTLGITRTFSRLRRQIESEENELTLSMPKIGHFLPLVVSRPQNLIFTSTIKSDMHSKSVLPCYLLTINSITLVGKSLKIFAHQCKMSHTVLLFFEKAKTQPQKDKMVHV